MGKGCNRAYGNARKFGREHDELPDADVVKPCNAIGASNHLKLEPVEQEFEQPMGEEGEMKEGVTGDGPTLADFVRNVCIQSISIDKANKLVYVELSLSRSSDYN